MIEIVVSPPASVGVALRVLDGHISAIQTPWEITPSRRFGSRTVRVVSLERQLQLFEKDCAFGKHVRSFVDLVRARLNVDIVELRETGHAVIECVGREWRSD